ncbi:MAG: GGDEF domain-containing protein [Rhodocyclaceae bacterium]|nr:GGDEF domain-containing protein [Rhodocyclaceae bacterium]MCA3074872.1 GGDEF domain-containing protein [Rhodocyclaceae bacterium]MCA3089741.1 GGDEF domain-containing protein [Rhodocyclaceae bacterium]MCA3094582.1 GGDEF domain-containing protein [Rhodocyclaceae bacterium]MCA3098230.1 GGDEF domain-containing protein [Rhodocyclaceae bacterium]
MQSVNPAVAGPVGPAAPTGKSPADFARETLRMLAVRKLAPTPDNYQRVYEEISGTDNQHADGTLEPMLGALRDLPRTDPALKEPVARLQRALVSRNWKAFGAEILALREASAGDPAAAPAMPLAAGALARLDAVGTPLSSVETLRRLLAEVLRNDVAPRFVIDPSLNAELVALADLAASADSTEACAQLATRLDAFWKGTAGARGLDARMVPELMGLVRLLIDNIGELVDDDQWIGGQVEVMRQLMARPPTPELLTDAQARFREIILRQGALKHSIADAKSTLKDMFSIFIERLGEMSDSTAVYHEKIGVHAERIERIEDIGSLKDVLDGLMGDMRDMQRDTLRSHDEVTAARRQAEAAESKIRQLETELEEISEKVREDALTGSLNRHGLNEALTREASRAERYGSALCVSVIDLDNFKKLNDTHGHSAGDEALVHLVTVAKALLRPSDTIGRYGGEEFVVLLPETTLDAGRVAIERLQRELTRQFFLANNERLLITFSAGVVQLRRGESEADVVRRADQAMYRAKEAGKNRVVAED